MTASRPFPRVFWVSLLLELLERLAYYGVYVNLQVYLTKTVGMTDIENGSLLGVFAFVRSLIPLATGTLADKIGFRLSLALSFTLYVGAYSTLFLLPSRPGAWTAVMGMAVAGAFLKPVVPATVKRYSPEERRREGFSYFYSSVNAGSVVGKVATNIVRLKISLRASMLNAVIACLIGLGVTLGAFKEPEAAAEEGVAPAPGTAGAPSVEAVAHGDAARPQDASSNPLVDLARAFMKVELAVFIVLIAGYYLLIEQFYQTFPTHSDRILRADEYREYITLINPASIAILQVPVGRLFARLRGPSAIALGVLVASSSMLLMGAVPTIAGACASYFVFAVAEMIMAPRYYEYISSFAPKGREGMYMGLAIVPVGLGGLIGGILSGRLISQYIPKEGPARPLSVWGTYAGIGLVCAILLGLYAAWIQRRRPLAKA